MTNQNSSNNATEERKELNSRQRTNRAEPNQSGRSLPNIGRLNSEFVPNTEPLQGSGTNANRGRQGLNGIRARSTTFRTQSGHVFSVINIGVDEGHPLADRHSMAGPSGLRNVQIGGIQMPAPQFVFRHRSDGPQPAHMGASPNPRPTGSSEAETNPD